MARITCQAALGFGCAAGAPAHAALWSIAPSMIWSVDDDSNRYLSDGLRASQSGVYTASAVFERDTETTQLSLTPWAMWQRIDDHQYANSDNRSLSGAFGWNGERQQLQLQAEIADFSTLESELTETGILANDVRRRQTQEAFSWNWALTERRTLLVQLSWMDVSYYGTDATLLNLLSGYKYPTAVLGEQFQLSPNTTLTASLFDDELIAGGGELVIPLAGTGLELAEHLPANVSREAGLKFELVHHFTERTQVDAYVGESGRTLRGVQSRGTLGGITGTLWMPRGHVDLNVSDTLVPYGTGVLVQRALATLSDTFNITETLDAQLALTRIQNNQSTVNLGLDRPYYDNATAALDWQWDQPWKLRLESGLTHTETFPLAPSYQTFPITAWRVALSLTWTPQASRGSFSY
ncbi:MAG TPA: hypothetical protein VMB48_17025 [Steroidobacteraceae bacterium]|nr:hypothetical protein [Steroidobacteraceae bacterium]